MTDDQLLLASAYLDGDLDAAEQARAEADVEVMAEVERLREVRELLRDVEAPDAARRDRALAAALSAFGATDAPRTTPSAPIPLPQRPRRAWWGLGAAAAALLAVIALGAAVARIGSSGDDDDSAGDAASTQAEVERLQPTAGTTDDDAEASAEAPAAADERASDTTTADAGGAPAATQAASTDHTATEATTAAADSESAIPRLVTPEQLADFASRDAALAAEESSGCAAAGTFVGRAIYRDRAVDVFADGSTVTALDSETCAVVDVVER